MTERRAADAAAIAEYIAKNGVTRLPPAFAAPTLAAAPPDASARLSRFTPRYEARLSEVVAYLRKQGRRVWTDGHRSRLDGDRCTRRELIVAANEYRKRDGLVPYAGARAVEGDTP